MPSCTGTKSYPLPPTPTEHYNNTFYRVRLPNLTFKTILTEHKQMFSHLGNNQMGQRKISMRDFVVVFLRRPAKRGSDYVFARSQVAREFPRWKHIQMCKSSVSVGGGNGSLSVGTRHPPGITSVGVSVAARGHFFSRREARTKLSSGQCWREHNTAGWRARLHGLHKQGMLKIHKALAGIRLNLPGRFEKFQLPGSFRVSLSRSFGFIFIKYVPVLNYRSTAFIL